MVVVVFVIVVVVDYDHDDDHEDVHEHGHEDGVDPSLKGRGPSRLVFVVDGGEVGELV